MPSMRLFKKRRSLAPGQGDAIATDVPGSTRLPYAASEQQATQSDVPPRLSAGPDGVSQGDVHGEGSHATSSDDVLFAPSAATEAQSAHGADDGRRNPKRDRFRLFRRGSTQFRKGPDDSGKGSGGGTRTRLSWTAPRSTASPTPLPEPRARTQAHTSTRGHAESEVVEGSVSAADASPLPLAAGPIQRNLDGEQPPPLPRPLPRQAQRRPTSMIGPSTTSIDTSSSSSWRLQTLKRLPSLSLKRRASRRDKPKPPQVVVTPATVVS